VIREFFLILLFTNNAWTGPVAVRELQKFFICNLILRRRQLLNKEIKWEEAREGSWIFKDHFKISLGKLRVI